MTALKFNNSFSQLPPQLFHRQPPLGLKQPFLVGTSHSAAALIGLDAEACRSPDFLQWASGNAIPAGAEPLAMVYAGHQFGGYSPQLGDGRGLLLGEVEGPEGKWDIHIKGAGKTPYSRFGDGRAVLRSSIREYLCSEAMAGLGIPTTRALCVVGSNTPVQRETRESGASLIRLARTHIRFGHFEYCYYTGQTDLLSTLAEYCLRQYFPALLDSDDRYGQFFLHIVKATAIMIAHWQAAGFAHGVMNTDNMSILGDTFDYGPYAFLDDYQAGFICNHSDHQGRYAFNRQPDIGLWNLTALANSLSPLIAEPQLQQALAQYKPTLFNYYNQLMRQKIGLQTEQPEDPQLIGQLLALMEAEQLDYHLSFRRLCDYKTSTDNPLRDHCVNREAFDQWAERYSERLAVESSQQAQRQQAMRLSNPRFVLRNYLAQQAIEQAEQQHDFTMINELMAVLSKPYDEHSQFRQYAEPPPEWGKRLEISCSS